MKSEPKSGIASLAGLAKAGSAKDDESKPDMEEDDDGDEYSVGLDELGEVLGVAADKQQAFAAAFKSAVMACK